MLLQMPPRPQVPGEVEQDMLLQMPPHPHYINGGYNTPTFLPNYMPDYVPQMPSDLPSTSYNPPSSSYTPLSTYVPYETPYSVRNNPLFRNYRATSELGNPSSSYRPSFLSRMEDPSSSSYVSNIANYVV